MFIAAREKTTNDLFAGRVMMRILPPTLVLIAQQSFKNLPYLEDLDVMLICRLILKDFPCSPWSLGWFHIMSPASGLEMSK